MPGSFHVIYRPINTKRDVFWAKISHTIDGFLQFPLLAIVVFVIPVLSSNLPLWLVISVGSILLGTLLYWYIDGVWRKHWFLSNNTGDNTEEVIAKLPDK